MKKSILITLSLFVLTSHIHAHIEIKPKKKELKRSKKAYFKTLVGLGLTTTAAGCIISGPIMTVYGPYRALFKKNRTAALGLIVGPILTALAFPLGETGINLMHKGLSNLWYDDEETTHNNAQQGKA